MDKTKILYVKDEKYFLFNGQEFIDEKPSLAKKYPVTLTVPPSALYVYSAKLPSSLNDEEAELQMDINMHEDGGANEEEEYATAILRHHLANDDSDLVDMLGLTKTQADALYGDIAKKTKAIDLMAPSFLIYKTLYKDQTQTSTDLYLYFSDEEAYGVLFRGGEYIAHRNIDNLAHISAHSGIELETLKALLKIKGVVEENYTPEELNLLTSVQDYISKAVERIIHTFNHKRGLFGLDGIDKVFIDFEGGIIPGCEEIFKAFGIEINTIESLVVRGNEDVKLHHDLIAASYLLDAVNGRVESINVTSFERELPFFKKPAGHFLTLLFVSCMVAALGWLFLQMSIDEQKEKISSLDRQITQATNIEKKAQAKSKKLNEELKVLGEKAKKITQEEEEVEQTGSAITMFDSSVIKRTSMVDDALRGLGQNKLGIKQMDQNGTTKISLHIVTTPSKQSNIANFIEYMAQKGYQKSYTKQIIQEHGMYESIVEIVR